MEKEDKKSKRTVHVASIGKVGIASNSISVISNRKHISLSAEDILYVHLVNRQSLIHVSAGKVYTTYTTIDDLAQMLGNSFIRADRATLVSTKGVRSNSSTASA